MLTSSVGVLRRLLVGKRGVRRLLVGRRGVSQSSKWAYFLSKGDYESHGCKKSGVLVILDVIELKVTVVVVVQSVELIETGFHVVFVTLAELHEHAQGEVHFRTSVIVVGKAQSFDEVPACEFQKFLLG